MTLIQPHRADFMQDDNIQEALAYTPKWVKEYETIRAVLKEERKERKTKKPKADGRQQTVTLQSLATPTSATPEITELQPLPKPEPEKATPTSIEPLHDPEPE